MAQGLPVLVCGVLGAPVWPRDTQVPPVAEPEYRAAVLAVIRATNGWIGATEIRPHVEGTAMQFRLAINQHIKAGMITRKDDRSTTRCKYIGADKTPQAPKAQRTRAPDGSADAPSGG